MRRIAVFAKVPVPGQVKTRLGPALPPPLACDLYRAMLEDALSAAVGAEAEETFLYWAEATGGAVPPSPPSFQPRIQRGADLGARLEQAFSELLLQPADRAVIVGADCPMLDAPRLRVAFEALEDRDLTLGPTHDGGYYLVGLGRQATELFQGVSWSTERVLAQTLERAATLGLSVCTLERLEDLDTPEDLVRWIGRVAATPRLLRLKTSEALAAMGLLPEAVQPPSSRPRFPSL